MANAIQDPVIEGTTYVVQLSNNVTSTGVVVLTVSWVPSQGKSVPTLQHAEIAPGASATLTGKVPPFGNATKMVILAAIGADETADLMLTDDGNILAQDTLDDATVWISLVAQAAKEAP